MKRYILLVLLVVVAGLAVWIIASPAGGHDPSTKGASHHFDLESRLQNRSSSSLRGHILASGGSPIAGAQVAAVIKGNEARRYSVAETDSQGRYAFPQLAAGDYVLVAQAPGHENAQRSVLLHSGHDYSDIDMVLAAGGVSLHGHVQDSGGGPIAGATLLLSGTDDHALAATQTDETGTYLLSILPGTFRVLVQAAGYASTTATVVIADNLDKDFQLHPASTIAGQVVAEHNDTLPQLASVQLFDLQRDVLLRETTADSNGRFSIEGVNPGDYRMAANSGQLAGTLGEVRVAAGADLLDLVIVVTPSPRVIGTVRSDDGSNIDAAVIGVAVVSPAGQKIVASTTSEKGRFQLDGVLPGSTNFIVGATGYATLYRTLLVGAQAVPIEFILESETTVTGRVLTSDGARVPNAQVQATVRSESKLDPLSYAETTTNAQGEFLLEGLRSGELDLEANAAGSTALLGPMIIHSGDRVSVDLILGSGASISGTIYGSDGDALGGVVVRGASAQASATVRETVSASDGSYVVGPFEGGPTWVWPIAGSMNTPSGFQRNRPYRAVELRADESKTGVDFHLDATNEHISGIVLKPDGEPLPGALVGASRDLDGFSQRRVNKSPTGNEVTTDAEGRFRIETLSQGVHTVWSEYPVYPEILVAGIAAGSEGVVMRFSAGSSVSGAAIYADGQPVPGFVIAAIPSALSGESYQRALLRRWGAAMAFPKKTVADALGRFRFDDLSPDTYDFVVVAEGGKVGAARNVVLSPNDSRSGMMIEVTQGAHVSGRVVEHGSGSPIEGVQVSLNLPTPVTATTESDGSFELQGALPDAPVSLWCFAGLGTYIPDGRQRNATDEIAALKMGDIPLLKGNAAASSQGTVGLAGENIDGQLVVLQVIGGSPAAAAGVHVGDRIHEVDGVAASALGGASLKYLLEGEPGTEVSLRVVRAETLHTFSLTRMPKS